MTIDIYAFRMVASPTAALTATRYSFIIPTTRIRELGIELGCVGTGSPVGTWSFEGSNDPAAVADFNSEQKTGTILGSSATGKFTAITASTVYGSALAITGASATNTYAAFVLGLPGYMRCLFTYTSGGSASSTAYVYANGR